MNKVTRLLGSTALATGLIFGGSAGAAVAGDYDRDGHKSQHSKHDNHKRHNHHHAGYHHGHHHGHNYNGHRHDRHWDDRYGYVYVHDHHDEDCNGKYHRASYKDYRGQWQVIFIIITHR